MGNLCCAADVLAEDFTGPELAVGDLIEVRNAGAYACTLTAQRFSSHQPVLVYTGIIKSGMLLHHYSHSRTPGNLSGYTGRPPAGRYNATAGLAVQLILRPAQGVSWLLTLHGRQPRCHRTLPPRDSDP